MSHPERPTDPFEVGQPPHAGTQGGGSYGEPAAGGYSYGGPPAGYSRYPPAHQGLPPGYPYPPPRRTNGLAIASMVLGIVWIYWIGSILALVFGYVARAQIRERDEGGDGMAIAGIVLGWVGVGFLSLFIAFGLLGAFASV